MKWLFCSTTLCSTTPLKKLAHANMNGTGNSRSRNSVIEFPSPSSIVDKSQISAEAFPFPFKIPTVRWTQPNSNVSFTSHPAVTLSWSCLFIYLNAIRMRICSTFYSLMTDHQNWWNLRPFWQRPFRNVNGRSAMEGNLLGNNRRKSYRNRKRRLRYIALQVNDICVVY